MNNEPLSPVHVVSPALGIDSLASASPPPVADPTVDEVCRILSRVLARLKSHSQGAPSQAQEEAA